MKLFGDIFMKKERDDEFIDKDFKDFFCELKESHRIFVDDLKSLLKEVLGDLNENLSELREGLRETFESDFDSTYGRETF